MRKVVVIALLAFGLLPGRAAALEGDELLALVAMPLAVAAVAETTEVPTTDMVEVVTVLNDAAVPPPQFIEIVRYAPAAIVVEERPDPFVVYLRDQYDAGLRGDRFVTVVQNRLRTYDLGPLDLNVVEPVQVTYLDTDSYYRPYYEPDTFFPPVVQTRITRQYVVPRTTVYDRNDLIALAAMPLAVAVASELTGVPSNDLFQMVSLLNQAQVPPAQFVEVVRYAPAALVIDDGREPFLVYLRDRYDAGLRGTQYVTVIESRLRDYDLGPFDIDRPRIVDYDPDIYYEPDIFFPPVVRTRIYEQSSHPHGGPPGQLKKELGLQTGAEVVHGSRTGGRIDVYEDRGRVERRVVRESSERGGKAARKQSGGKSKRSSIRSEPQQKEVRKRSVRGESKGKAKRDSARLEVAPQQQQQHRGHGQQMKAERQRNQPASVRGGGGEKKADGGEKPGKGKGRGKGRR